MEWTCPHCQTRLSSPQTEGAAPEPRPGWKYSRCFKCGGYALVERETGQAEKVERKSRPPKSRHTPSPPKGTQLKLVPQSNRNSSEPPPHSTLSPGPLKEPFRPITVSSIKKTRSPLRAAFITSTATLVVTLAIGSQLISHLPVPVLTKHPLQITPPSSPENSKSPASPGTTPSATQEAISANLMRATEAAARITPFAAKKNSSDSIHSAAMAPIRETPAQRELQVFLHAREGVRVLEIRSGPGAEFPVMGSARIEGEYPVMEWKGRWFRIALDEEAKRTAWVHYDKIELISEEGGK